MQASVRSQELVRRLSIAAMDLMALMDDDVVTSEVADVMWRRWGCCMGKLRKVLLTDRFQFRDQEDDVLVVLLKLPNSDGTCSTMRDLVAIYIHASQ